MLDNKFTNDLHDNINAIREKHARLLAEIAQCERELKKASKQAPQLETMYSEFASYVEGKWLLVQYVSKPRDDDDHKAKPDAYSIEENPKLTEYFYCEKAMAPKDFFDGSPIVLNGAVVNGFGRSATKYKCDPIIKFNANCLIDVSHITKHGDGYMFGTGYEHMMPTITLLAGDELKSVQEFVVKWFRNLAGQS